MVLGGEMNFNVTGAGRTNYYRNILTSASTPLAEPANLVTTTYEGTPDTRCSIEDWNRCGTAITNAAELCDANVRFGFVELKQCNRPPPTSTGRTAVALYVP
jgi:hypothetical protein